MSTQANTTMIEDEGGSIVASTAKAMLDKVQAAVQSSAKRRAELVAEIVKQLPASIVHVEMARPHLMNLVRVACLHADDYGIGELRGVVMVGRRDEDQSKFVQASVMGKDIEGRDVNCATVYLDRVRGVMAIGSEVAG